MPSSFRSSFQQLLEIADSQRPGYRSSLGDGLDLDTIRSMLPVSDYFPWLVDVYSLVSGTPRGIQNQSLMDLVPGYRLVELQEVASGDHWEGQRIVPLLSNYSSDHIAFIGTNPNLWSVGHDDCEARKLYDSPDTFVHSLIEYYRTGAYFLDPDGYLDYDPRKVSEIRRRLNPESESC